MAAVTAPTNAALCSPPGYENVDTGYASVDLKAGQLVIFDTAGAPSSRWEHAFKLAPTTATEAHGISLKATKAGGTAEIAFRGEMDGFSGLTVGAGLYPSSATAGGMDTTAPTFYSVATTPAVAVPVPARIRAVTATRIRFDLV